MTWIVLQTSPKVSTVLFSADSWFEAVKESAKRGFLTDRHYGVYRVEMFDSSINDT